MSDANRPRRTTTKQPIKPPSEPTTDAKTARDELSQMLHRDTKAVRRSAPPVKRNWDVFDDIPETPRRRPPPLQDVEVAPQDVPVAPRDVPLPPRPGREFLDDDEEYRRPRYSSVATSRADVRQAQAMRGTAWATVPQPPLYGEARRNPLIMLIIAGISLAVIAMFLMPQRTSVGLFTDPQGLNDSAEAPLSAPPAPSGEHSILGAPSLTERQIEAVLADYGSPAAGTGRDWITLGEQYGIDPAYALAFFVVESSAGTAPGWAGWKSDGSSTHNIGNIICAGYPTCHGRFRDYPSWQVGIEDWYKLISVEYVGGRGVHTVEQIIPIYAPAFENDVPAYVGNVERMVAEWRAN